jgi:hypothetical protein
MADTIATRRAHLLLPYRRAFDAELKFASARELVKLALRETGMLAAHRKHLLKLAQWWVTEADGKWKTRFRSAAVIELAQGDPQSPKAQTAINHEHVYGRAELADRMLRDPSQVDSILELCEGCIVTVDEHRELTLQKHVQGWDRYREAGVLVRDMALPDWPLHVA